MPWDGTELWLADLTPHGTLTRARRVAGGRDESLFQPEWAPVARRKGIRVGTGGGNLIECNVAHSGRV